MIGGQKTWVGHQRNSHTRDSYATELSCLFNLKHWTPSTGALKRWRHTTHATAALMQVEHWLCSLSRNTRELLEMSRFGHGTLRHPSKPGRTRTVLKRFGWLYRNIRELLVGWSPFAPSFSSPANPPQPTLAPVAFGCH